MFPQYLHDVLDIAITEVKTVFFFNLSMETDFIDLKLFVFHGTSGIMHCRSNSPVNMEVNYAQKTQLFTVI